MRASVATISPKLRSSEGRLFGEGRGVGLHLSDIIKAFKLAVDGPPKPYTNDNFSYFGLMFEIWVGWAMARYFGYDIPFVVPEEMEVEGVFMNPDGFEPVEERIWEFKCVWKWCLDKVEPSPGVLDIEEFKRHFWAFLVQVMGYCKGMGCLRASIVILFVSGTKGAVWGPQFRVFNFEFTQKEIDQNWQNVLQQAELLRGSR